MSGGRRIPEPPPEKHDEKMNGHAQEDDGAAVEDSEMGTDEAPADDSMSDDATSDDSMSDDTPVEDSEMGDESAGE